MNRQQLGFDPFTISNLSITQTPHFGEKYIEMVWIVASRVRAWTQSAPLKSGTSTGHGGETLESSGVGGCYIVTLLSSGEKGWTTGDSGYYCCLVCNFRHDMAGVAREGVHCAFKRRVWCVTFLLQNNFHHSSLFCPCMATGLTAMLCTIHKWHAVQCKGRHSEYTVGGAIIVTDCLNETNLTPFDNNLIHSYSFYF